MKVYFNQLRAALDKQLAPLYLVVGDEPLQRMEAVDTIFEAARRHGFEERQSFVVTEGFDWKSLEVALNTPGLFSRKRQIDVLLMSNAAGGVGLFRRFIASPPEGTLLIIRAQKIDGRLAWVKQAASIGVLVQVYKKNPKEMKSWLRERMLRAGLKMEDKVVDIIAENTEGNMLAAAQEVVRLSLLHPEAVIRQEDALASISDSTRFSPYDLADAAVSGDGKRAVRILLGLRAEDQPISLILWGVTTQVRKLAALAQRVASGENIDVLLKSEWRSKRGVLGKALNRRLGERWQRLLFWCWETDKAIKGAGDDECWNELLGLILRISGARALNRRFVHRPAMEV